MGTGQVLLLVVGSLVGGFALGSWISAKNKPTGLGPEDARKLLRRLRSIAASMSEEVGEHTSLVETMTKELQSPVVAESRSDPVTVVLHAVTTVLEANRTLLKKLANTEAKLEEQARELESYMSMARTDPLTQLANRRAFDEELSRRIAERQRRGIPMTIAMFDLDHFKKLNDHWGHMTGDYVLRGVARILTDTVREMDLVARYGGEEFAIIFPATGASVALNAAKRICTTMRSIRFRVDTSEHRVTLSAGVAEAQSGEDAASLVKRSDVALYASKEGGRNCIHFHDGAECQPVAIEGPALAEVTYQC